MHGTALSWKEEWFTMNCYYSLFTGVVNRCCSGRPICRRKCLRGNELRAGRLFACRPPRGPEEGRNIAATAYAIRSWKKSAGLAPWRKNSGLAKKVSAKAQTMRNNALAQRRQRWGPAVSCPPGGETAAELFVRETHSDPFLRSFCADPFLRAFCAQTPRDLTILQPQ